MSTIFGKSIDYTFTIIDNNGDTVPVYSGGLVSARIYSSAPSNDEIDLSASGSALETVTTWSGSADLDNAYIINFSPVVDPTPHSVEPNNKYYVVVNFTFENGSPTTFAEEVLFIYRADSWTSRISILPQDLFDKETKFNDEFVSAQLKEHIDTGINRFHRKLKQAGIKVSRTFNRTEFNDAVYYASLASATLDLYTESTPSWLEKHNKYEELFSEIVNALQVNYDSQGDDNPESDEIVRTNITFIER